jgi:methylmalonyl-CoA mutase
LNIYPDKTIAVISVDPSRKKTGGALLGDRIRMNSISHPRAYMRSLATRDDNTSLSNAVEQALDICKSAAFDFIILESAGVGQSDASILDYCDVSMYVMTPEYGAASQLEKINMLDYADIVCINKFDKAGALDALHDVRKQYKRNRNLWNAKDEELPVLGTIASQFNDAGINELFEKIMIAVEEKTKVDFGTIEQHKHIKDTTSKSLIIPPKRVRYLSEITENNKTYDNWVNEQCTIASKLYKIAGVLEEKSLTGLRDLQDLKVHYEQSLHRECKQLIDDWPSLQKKYGADFFEYIVRDKTIKQPLISTSLSGTKIPKIVLPKCKDWGDILKWQLQENVPGEFPFTSGVFELKRQGEDQQECLPVKVGPNVPINAFTMFRLISLQSA